MKTGLTAKNLIQHEIIGLETTVSKAKNKSMEGIKGKITDETQNTVTVQSGNKTRKLPKEQITLAFTINGKTVEVEGKYLVGRPEERTKNEKGY